MKRKIALLIILVSIMPILCFSQNFFAFKDGKFKILQFTDMHWNPSSSNSTITQNTIKDVLKKENPDLAVLTGDIITGEPALEGWETLIHLFEEAKTPFTVTMGNHDPEYSNKKLIYHLLKQSNYYVGEEGPQNIKGVGNYTIPIYNSKNQNKVEAVLYCFDSNDYLSDKKYGHYDWIDFNQIQWYRQQSMRYSEGNAGKPIPSLAFFHIPLIEYHNIVNQPNTLGNYLDDGIGASKINSGLFGSFVDMKDIMGVFTGHDHDNDFIGVHYGIALGYGRVTGADAYGNLERGGRVIELYEGKSQFDSWISTPTTNEHVFYYPSELSSKDEENMKYFPAKKIKSTLQGIKYSYYEGKFKKTSQVTSAKKVREGRMENFSIDGASVADHFGYDFKTFIKIPEKGVYRFYTFSDDGSKLYIDGEEIVNNDGGHSAKRAEGKIALEKGFHELRVIYFDDYMGEKLEVGFSSRHIMETALPKDILFISKKQTKN